MNNCDVAVLQKLHSKFEFLKNDTRLVQLYGMYWGINDIWTQVQTPTILYRIFMQPIFTPNLFNHLLIQPNQSVLLCFSENDKKIAKGKSDAYNMCFKWFSRLTGNKIKDFE